MRRVLSDGEDEDGSEESMPRRVRPRGKARDASLASGADSGVDDENVVNHSRRRDRRRLILDHES